tara:strand:+ start:3522 stop:3806 length:285 start_codon:yes stop_codon:yes gene_type:complete
MLDKYVCLMTVQAGRLNISIFTRYLNLTTLFAKGMIAPDGIQWDRTSKALYGSGDVIVRGDQAYVTNFDAAFGVPTMVNTKPDAPSTISVFNLK